MSASSRRDFLKLTSSAAGMGWMSTQLPVLLALGQTACTARENQEPFVNLDDNLGADLAAIAAQIIPTDDTPGATEAGVVYFMDAAFGSFMKGAAGFIKDGIDELNESLSEQHPGKRFAMLGFEQQRAVLEARQDSRFFGTLRFLTVTGMFAMPQHGGNKDELGWQLLGFDHQHHWQPPFGYYDTGEHGND